MENKGVHRVKLVTPPYVALLYLHLVFLVFLVAIFGSLVQKIHRPNEIFLKLWPVLLLSFPSSALHRWMKSVIEIWTFDGQKLVCEYEIIRNGIRVGTEFKLADIEIATKNFFGIPGFSIRLEKLQSMAALSNDPGWQRHLKLLVARSNKGVPHFFQLRSNARKEFIAAIAGKQVTQNQNSVTFGMSTVRVASLACGYGVFGGGAIFFAVSTLLGRRPWGPERIFIAQILSSVAALSLADFVLKKVMVQFRFRKDELEISVFGISGYMRSRIRLGNIGNVDRMAPQGIGIILKEPSIWLETAAGTKKAKAFFEDMMLKSRKEHDCDIWISKKYMNPDNEQFLSIIAKGAIVENSGGIA